MTHKTAAEKRRHPRVWLGVTLDFRMQGPAAGKCRGTIADLSAGGMTFKTDTELEKGMTLHLCMNPGLQIRGEVLNVLGPAGGQRRYGVRFHKVGLNPTTTNLQREL